VRWAAWRGGEKCEIPESKKWRLHPLIHTLPKFILPQDIESINKRSSDVQRISGLSPAASGGAIVMDSPTLVLLDLAD
jgi:hypothetical protein